MYHIYISVLYAKISLQHSYLVCYCCNTILSLNSEISSQNENISKFGKKIIKNCKIDGEKFKKAVIENSLDLKLWLSVHP